jgi:hypothetical protein
MTTPETESEPLATGVDPAAEGRVQRPAPERDGPIRAGIGPEPSREPKGGDVPISQSVADAVRAGYGVIADNIKQGREAAESFRRGEYHIRDVPRDVDALAKRMIDLARDLSTTTLDVVERLLRESRAPDGPNKAPAFHPNPHPAGPKGSDEPKPQSAPGIHLMRVNCCFTGNRRAIVRSAALTRPLQPIFAEEHLTAEPLSSTSGARAITDVTFEADKSGGGLIITIATPDDQPAGVYAGMVYAPHQDWPLGVLAVEVLA